MKSLVNAQTAISIDGGNTACYVDLIRPCLSRAPKDGFAPDEMRRRIKVLDCLDEMNGKIEMEDAVAETLKECVAAMRWAVLDPELVRFIDRVEAL